MLAFSQLKRTIQQNTALLIHAPIPRFHLQSQLLRLVKPSVKYLFFNFHVTSFDSKLQCNTGQSCTVTVIFVTGSFHVELLNLKSKSPTGKTKIMSHNWPLAINWLQPFLSSTPKTENFPGISHSKVGWQKLENTKNCTSGHCLWHRSEISHHKNKNIARPRSSRLCSRRLWNETLVPQTLLLLSWKTQLNWNWFQNKLPCDEGRELYHFLLHCFDVQMGKNMMASQRNTSFLQQWTETFHGWWQQA